jgi:hypothetical protein
VVMGCSRDPLPAAKMTACMFNSPRLFSDADEHR